MVRYTKSAYFWANFCWRTAAIWPDCSKRKEEDFVGRFHFAQSRTCFSPSLSRLNNKLLWEIQRMCICDQRHESWICMRLKIRVAKLDLYLLLIYILDFLFVVKACHPAGAPTFQSRIFSTDFSYRSKTFNQLEGVKYLLFLQPIKNGNLEILLLVRH